MTRETARAEVVGSATPDGVTLRLSANSAYGVLWAMLLEPGDEPVAETMEDIKSGTNSVGASTCKVCVSGRRGSWGTGWGGAAPTSIGFGAGVALDFGPNRPCRVVLRRHSIRRGRRRGSATSLVSVSPVNVRGVARRRRHSVGALPLLRRAPRRCCRSLRLCPAPDIGDLPEEVDPIEAADVHTQPFQDPLALIKQDADELNFPEPLGPDTADTSAPPITAAPVRLITPWLRPPPKSCAETRSGRPN